MKYPVAFVSLLLFIVLSIKQTRSKTESNGWDLFVSATLALIGLASTMYG